jgi:Peptidase family M28
MKDKNTGWQEMLEGYPWFRCKGCYPIRAYSEYMPPPLIDFKPYGEPDYRVLSGDDPFGWKITEIEEEYELRPGIEHIGQQIMSSIIKLGRGLTEHYITGHGGENLINNPYWPPDLARRSGSLHHERYVTLLPLMMSRTQDDKGRVTWTFFGNSVHDPGYAFWRCFYSAPGEELPENDSLSFFKNLLSDAYGERLTDERSLMDAGFRISITAAGDPEMPRWTGKFIVPDNSSFDEVRYLLTFRPFSQLPAEAGKKYLEGSLNLLPFPGSLVFWGMPGYLALKKELAVTSQIPLLNLVSRNRGIGGLRVTQSGWIHETRAGNNKPDINPNLIHDTYHRTHRWERLHVYQDELNQVAEKIPLIKALFSTEADAMGLYNKPMACNSHIWSDSFRMLLNGPVASRKEIFDAEKRLLKGGLFGYRLFFPPMRVGIHDIYLHRPLVAFEDSVSGKVEIRADSLYGFMAGYPSNDVTMSKPVELWPRMLKRDLYLSALNDFNGEHDYFVHQTALNIISLIDSRERMGRTQLSGSFAFNLLNLSRHASLKEWFDDLDIHAASAERAKGMRSALEAMIDPPDGRPLTESLTYTETATRQFEVAWWNDIKFLAQGEYIYKDNADIMLDETTLSRVVKKSRDIELLGDYLISRYRKAIGDARMEGKAVAGELPFKWNTLFDFSQYGGWVGNQNGTRYERNILLVIPGKNHRQAVVLADHYDTAYMEDVYEKERGGSGARLAARGADDDYSASSALLQAAPVFLRMAAEGKLERDIWLLHLTGEEFPSDCMGARNFCQALVEKNLILKTDNGTKKDLSDVEIAGIYVMDMIGHNRDTGQDIFQISPGKNTASLKLAWHAHIANMIWNEGTNHWNRKPDRVNKTRGKRISAPDDMPETAKHLQLKGEVRTQFNPHSSIFNTDGQIFSDTGVPVVLFMENYDINRTGYHDSMDTMENIDLDYGAAFAAIAIETIARAATLPEIDF